MTATSDQMRAVRRTALILRGREAGRHAERRLRLAQQLRRLC
jgi:hypothetical protein